MKKIKLLKIVLLALIILFDMGAAFYQPDYEKENIDIEVDMYSDTNGSYSVFYNNSEQETGNFFPTQVSTQTYTGNGKEATLTFTIPANSDEFRFDPTETVANTYVKSIRVVKNGVLLSEINPIEYVNLTKVDVTIADGEYLYSTTDTDGFVIYSLDVDANVIGLKDAMHSQLLFYKIFAVIIVDLLLLYIISSIEKVLLIPIEVWKEKRLIVSLGKNDFKTRFAGSYLGIIWAFVQPIVTVLVYWFVFEKALNAGTQSTKEGINVPYVLWLVAGLVPWFYFSELLSTGTSVLLEYSYLVKKVVFNISSLPVVKVISSLFVHMFFIIFTLVLYLCYGYTPSVYMLQVFYYTFAAVVLGMGLIYLTSAISVFFRDLSQIVTILLQIGVWFTPIMWNIDAMTLSTPVIFILKLNPMYYVVMGYRDSLINQVWFWENPGQTIYFWVVAIIIFIFGTSVFRKLKIHFADVL